MLRDRVARRRAAVYGALVVLCLVLLAVSRTAPVEDLRKGINFALGPIQETLAQGARTVGAMVAAMGEMDRLRLENADLSRRVDELEDQLAKLSAVRQENERLSRLLETRNSFDRATVAAAVVSREATQFERVVTIDRGTESGIEVGDAVLSEGGALAGTVIEVGRSYATARLISDTRSLVIGIDEASRATGEVTGRLSAPLAMGNVPVTDKLGAQDLVVTAGLSLGRDARSFYPKGLLIGRVVDVLTDPGAIVQTALLEPAADLDHLENVLVITDYKAPSLADLGTGQPTDTSEDFGASQDGGAEADASAGPKAEPEPSRKPRPRRAPTPRPTYRYEAP